MSAPPSGEGGARPRGRGFAAVLLRELRHILPPTLFFLVGFNLIVLTTQLAVNGTPRGIAGFVLASTAALVVGKTVLVANLMPVLRRFDTAPLFRTILFKTAFYWGLTLIARLIERVLGYLLSEGNLAGLPGYFAEHFQWGRFLAIQIWIMVLFALYVTATEIDGGIGPGGLRRILFAPRHSHPTAQHRTAPDLPGPG